MRRTLGSFLYALEDVFLGTDRIINVFSTLKYIYSIHCTQQIEGIQRLQCIRRLTRFFGGRTR